MDGAANFDYWEFAPRSWPDERRHNWTPDYFRKIMIRALAVRILQPTRDQWGRLDITSGIRTIADHHRLIDAGYHPSIRSDHFYGLAKPIMDDGDADVWPFTVGAVDFVPAFHSARQVWQWMRENLYGEYGQLLLETQTKPDGTVVEWIHVSNPKDLVWSWSIARRVRSQIVDGYGVDGVYRMA